MKSSFCNLFRNDLSFESRALPIRQSFVLEPLETRLLLSVDLLAAPDWSEQGPAPAEDSGVVVPQNNEVSGAMQSIAVNPNDNTEIIIGTVNGGVWRTTNASTAAPGAITWTPLTDQLGSLSIGAVAYDPADATGNTFYAATGLFGNGFDSGGGAVGLYRTTDGGATWALLGDDGTGLNILAGNRIHALAISGQNILAGTINGTGIGNIVQPGDFSRDYGVLGGELYRSADGGTTFALVDATTGLPTGAVPSVVFNPNAPLQAFAAVAGVGVFRSDDGGATWNAFSTGLTNTVGSSDIELATQNIGGTTTLFATVATGNTLNGVFSANNFTGGGNWAALPGVLPAISGGANFGEKVQIVADPVNAGVIYATGQGASAIFRFDPGGGGNWVQINGPGAQGGTTPHADPRDLVFLGNDTLLEVDDGGFYFIQNPTNAAVNSWNSFNGDLGAFELYYVAYDSTNDIIITGTQDNGSPYQDNPDDTTWSRFLGGDGQFQGVDTTSLAGGDVFRYSLSNNFSNFERNRFTNANGFVSAAQVGLRSTFAAADLSGLIAADSGFTGFSLMPFALNSVDPQMMLLGFNGLYEDADTAAANGFAGDVITNITAGLGGNGLLTAMAYGGVRGGTGFTNVAVVGDLNGGLWFRGEAGAAFTNVTAQLGSGAKINSIALDPQDWRKVYVVSNNQVFSTANITNLVANPFQVIGGGPGDNLNTLASQLRSVEVVGSTPVVGALGGLFRNIDGVWSEFGEGLPNTVVRDVQWDATDDVLIVGTFGRGAWTIDNASDAIDDVTVLQIIGDEDFMGQDDTIILVRDAANPSLLNVFLNGDMEQFQLSVIQQINVFGLFGDDTLIVDSSNGLINVGNGIRYDGDGGFDDLQLLQTEGLTWISDTYSVGPDIGSGISTIVGGAIAGTQVVSFESLSPVLDLVPVALLTVNATATDNAINYSIGSAATRGLVTIDEHEPIEFSNKTTLVINAGAGQDTVNVNNPNTPTGLTAITVNGGPPGSGDGLIVTGAGVAVTVNTASGSIAGATGTAGAVSMTFATIETLDLAGSIGDLTVTTTGADDTVTVTPGLNTGANSGTVQSSGAVPQISFVNSGTLTANLAGGDDTVVVNGSSDADTVAVSGTAVAITGRRAINYTGAEHLTVNGSAGADTFNVTPSPTVAMFIDGGDPIGVLPGDLLNIIAGGSSVTFNAGPEIDEGSFEVGANQPVSFDHIESFGITGSGPAVINGTNGPDAITAIARDASTHAAADGVQDFTVSVNTGPELLFIDVASVTVNALSGSDQVTLQTPAPNNAVWDVDVTVNGGAPAADTDRLIVQTPGPAGEVAAYTPTAFDGGILDLTSLSSPVTINGTEVLIYDGQADNDSLTVAGTGGDDTIIHTPGVNDQAGSFQVNSLLALSYQNLGSGASLTANGGGGTNTLVYIGTAGNDIFTVGVAGQVALNTRIVVNSAGIQVLTLEGLDGDDVFTLIPAISASVYQTMNFNGGGQSSATGDRVFLIGTGVADDIVISGQSVSLGGKTVNGSGIEDIRLDALAGNDRITYNGVAGVTENITVGSSGAAGGGQISIPGVALVNFSGVERILVNGNTPSPSETDTLTFAGTNAVDTFNINLAAAGTSADPVLRLQNGTTLLTLENYTNFNTLRVLGLDGADTFNVNTAAGPSTGRNLFVDGGLPSGKKKSTDNLNIFYTPPRPSIIHSAETQDPDAGIVDLDYGTARFVVQYDDVEHVVIRKN